jgi:hypothetical protein
VKHILRYCQGDPRATGRKRRVSHYVTLKRFHKRDAPVPAKWQTVLRMQDRDFFPALVSLPRVTLGLP